MGYPPSGGGLWIGVGLGPSTYPCGGMLGATPTRSGAKKRRTRRAIQPGATRLLNRPFGGWLSWMVSARGSFRGGFVFCAPPGGFGVGVTSFLWGNVGPKHHPDQGRSKDEPTEPANPGRDPRRPEPGQNWPGAEAVSGRLLNPAFRGWPVWRFPSLHISFFPSRGSFAVVSFGALPGWSLAVVSSVSSFSPDRFGVGVKIALRPKFGKI